MSSDPPDETRMRAALGLLQPGTGRSASSRPDYRVAKRRFARDGEVEVTVINGAGTEPVGVSTRDRLIAAERELEAEREAHARTKRALQEAISAVHGMETKLAHTQMARDEALAVERAARQRAEDALRELREKTAVSVKPPEESSTVAAASGGMPVLKRRPGRPRRAVVEAAEPEPVKWWLPSYRAARGSK